MLILASKPSQTSIPDSAILNLSLTFLPKLLYWFPSSPSWLRQCLLPTSSTCLPVCFPQNSTSSHSHGASQLPTTETLIINPQALSNPCLFRILTRSVYSTGRQGTVMIKKLILLSWGSRSWGVDRDINIVWLRIPKSSCDPEFLIMKMPDIDGRGDSGKMNSYRNLNKNPYFASFVTSVPFHTPTPDWRPQVLDLMWYPPYP